MLAIHVKESDNILVSGLAIILEISTLRLDTILTLGNVDNSPSGRETVADGLQQHGTLSGAGVSSEDQSGL